MSNKKVIPVTHEPQTDTSVNVIRGKSTSGPTTVTEAVEALEELEEVLREFIEDMDAEERNKEQTKEILDAYDRAMRGV